MPLWLTLPGAQYAQVPRVGKDGEVRREGFAFHDSGKLPGKVLGGAAIDVTDALAVSLHLCFGVIFLVLLWFTFDRVFRGTTSVLGLRGETSSSSVGFILAFRERPLAEQRSIAGVVIS